jgi:hypothetical protein
MILSIAGSIHHGLCERVKMSATRLSRLSVTDWSKSKLTYLIQSSVSGKIAGADKTPVVLGARREVLV